jgi:hypothetical protein
MDGCPSSDDRLAVGRFRRGSCNDFLSTGTHGVLNQGQIELADGWNSVLALRPIDASAGLGDG